MPFIFGRKNNALTPADLKVYTPINNVPSKTKWHNKVGEPLYTISGMPICLTFAIYIKLLLGAKPNGSCNQY